MNGDGARILVVEDDAQIRSFICYALNNEGFSCDVAGTVRAALDFLEAGLTDIVLLDLGLPDGDGMDVLKKTRELSETPVIVISSRDQDSEKVSALDAGADDYLTKPFSAAELMARVRVALRHLLRQTALPAHPVHSVGGLRLDQNKRLVFLDGAEVHVTPMEYSLLSLFFDNIGKVLTAGNIIREIWGAGYGNDTQSLRALMAGLRRKIEKNPAKPRYIKTEVGVGYRLVNE